MRAWIEATFDLLQQDLGEEGVINRLAAMGCSVRTAEKLVCFLPLACGRALLADSGIIFSSAFRCMGEDGTIGEPRPLAADSDWVAIERWLATNKSTRADAVRLVGMQSSEFDAVNKALIGGSRLSNLVGSDPIFRLTDPTPEPESRKSPWWAFWRQIKDRVALV